jgi:hypothetical protein
MTHASANGDPLGGHAELAFVWRFIRAFDPATIDQQDRPVTDGAQRRDDVVAIAAVYNDVIEQDLVFTVIGAGYLEALVWRDVQAVVPGGEIGFIFK